MAKSSSRKTLEQQIAELNELRAQPQRADADALLRRALGAARAPLAAAAANIIGEAELNGFEPALASAFEHWMTQPAKTDPGCTAKTSIVHALYRLGARAHALYLRGIRCVQKEPVWGGSEDSAAQLRGLCALALVCSGYYDALVEAAELLADPQPGARLAAAEAIAYSERQDVGVPLLRFKARLGDSEPRVIAACFTGLLSLAPDSSLEFVASFIEAADDMNQQAAILALGESRSAGAFAVLRRTAESSLRSESRAVAYIAIAVLRSDEAWDYLLHVVREEPVEQAGMALSALGHYRSLESLGARALEAARQRGDAVLLRRATELFAPAG